MILSAPGLVFLFLQSLMVFVEIPVIFESLYCVICFSSMIWNIRSLMVIVYSP